MDQRERGADHTAAMKVALAGWQRGIWTALPALVTAYDPATNTCTCQPTIKAVIVQQDPTTNQQTQAPVNLPTLIHVPVVFPGGGGYSMTFPIKSGDEVLVVFSSRCIDAWWQSGGVQQQIEHRAHDLSDGIAIVGLRSVPAVPANISTTTMQIRSDDGTSFIELDASNNININAPTHNLTFNTMNATLDAAGNLAVKGSITAGMGGADLVTLQAHTHALGPVPDPGH